MPILALTEQTQQGAFRHLVNTLGETFPEAAILPSWGMKARVDAKLPGMHVILSADVDKLPGHWTFQLILGDKVHDPLELRTETDLQGALSWARGFFAITPPPWSRLSGSSDEYFRSEYLREIAWAAFFQVVDRPPKPVCTLKEPRITSQKGNSNLCMKFDDGPRINIQPVRPQDCDCDAIEVFSLDRPNGDIPRAEYIRIGPVTHHLLNRFKAEHPDWAWQK